MLTVTENNNHVKVSWKHLDKKKKKRKKKKENLTPISSQIKVAKTNQIHAIYQFFKNNSICTY